MKFGDTVHDEVALLDARLAFNVRRDDGVVQPGAMTVLMRARGAAQRQA